jgi:hypothetical protein
MADWTVMVFMAGDNNLSSAAEDDLAELRRVGSTASVRVVVEVDRAGTAPSERRRIERDGVGETALELGETDSGDPDALLGFVRWAVAEEPAERYALVLWNHGGGWAPAEIERVAAERGAAEWSPGEARERSRSGLARVFFRPSLATILALPSPHERAICSDDASGHSLDTVELGRVLATICAELGRPLDLLGMDACLMSNLEVAYEVRSMARAIVASEETEPGGGWAYDRVLRAFGEDPKAATVSIAGKLVSAYAAAHVAAGPRERITQTALDTAAFDGLAALLDALSAALVGDIAGRAAEVWSAQRRAARFCGDTLWDLLDLAGVLGATTRDAAVGQAAAALAAALRPGAGAIVAAAQRGPGLARCGGLSVYLPALREVSPFYAELAFARRQERPAWPGFLNAYRQVLSRSPVAAGAAVVPRPGGALA